MAVFVTPWGSYRHMKNHHSAAPQNRQIKYTSLTKPGAKGVQFCTCVNVFHVYTEAHIVSYLELIFWSSHEAFVLDMSHSNIHVMHVF